MSYVLDETGRRRPFLPVPFAAARIQAGFMEVVDKLTFAKLPRALAITRDQLRMLEHDNLVSQSAKAEGRTLDGIGIPPTAFEAIVPSYLWRFRRIRPVREDARGVSGRPASTARRGWIGRGRASKKAKLREISSEMP